MNMQMMILCDCVAQEQSDANKTDLYRFIADLSEIIEIKAVAMKDLHDSVTKPQANNLYLAWVAFSGAQKSKQQFLEWINAVCEEKVSAKKIKDSRFYDAVLFNNVTVLMEAYYSSTPEDQLKAKL